MIRSARPGPRELRRAEAATWGAKPGAIPARTAERPRMRLVPGKPMAKGALCAFATVELPIRLKLIDCPVFVGSSGRWASLPSKPVLGREGKQAKPNGRPQFAPVLAWRNRELADRFSGIVVDLIRAAHPGALDGGARP
jgi:hypothetical protein